MTTGQPGLHQSVADPVRPGNPGRHRWVLGDWQGRILRYEHVSRALFAARGGRGAHRTRCYRGPAPPARPAQRRRRDRRIRLPPRSPTRARTPDPIDTATGKAIKAGVSAARRTHRLFLTSRRRAKAQRSCRCAGRRLASYRGPRRPGKPRAHLRRAWRHRGHHAVRLSPRPLGRGPGQLEPGPPARRSSRPCPWSDWPAGWQRAMPVIGPGAATGPDGKRRSRHRCRPVPFAPPTHPRRTEIRRIRCHFLPA